jgi:hypothetical protein
MANAIGRPVTRYTPEERQRILKKLEKYIEDNPLPIIAEFAYQNKIPRKIIYELPELSDALKFLIDKKEANLEKGMVSGKWNSNGCKFSLAQLGWRERSEIDTNVKADITGMDKYIVDLLKGKK